MSDERDEPRGRAISPSQGRAGRATIAITLGLVAAVGYVGVDRAVTAGPEATQNPGVSVTTPSEADNEAQAAVERAAAGGTLVQKLATTVMRGDKAGFDRAVDPAATDFDEQADQVYGNLRALPLASLAMRYVSEDAGALAPSRRDQLGGTRAWVAKVEISWQLKKYDAQPVRVVIPMTLVSREGTTYLASLSDRVGPGQRRPFWMLGKLRVKAGDHSLVVSLDPAADLTEYARLADKGVDAVTEVWGRNWRRSSVVYLPATQGQMEAMLGARQNTYGQIAAVTSSEGDERHAGVPVRIVANPTLFKRLGTQGRRLVLTHETTHVASGATLSAVPLWLAEGFADYVAFEAVEVSTASAAKELFKAIRAGKGPKTLPSPAAFGASSQQLALAYESSWLACRLIEYRYGEDKLVEFYRAVHTSTGAGGLRAAFTDVLGTTEEKFVTDWLRYMSRLADG